MDVTCPNCGARYRLKHVAAPGKRMRCAECDYRWAPVAEMPGEHQAFGSASGIVPSEGVSAAAAPAADGLWADAAPAPPSTDETVTTADDEPEPRPRLLRTLAAIVLGLALFVVAAGLWIGDRAAPLLGSLPIVGDMVTRPAVSPLTVVLRGTTTRLPSGKLLLDVTATLTNPTAATLPVPPLAATLAGPRGTALRWTIDPPVAMLAAGDSATVTATVTGFPADARTLSVALTR